MSQNSKKPQGCIPRASRNDHFAAGGRSSDSVQRSAINRERARWHITLGSIRAHLDEQPSRGARRAAARRWCAAIAEMGEEWTP